MTSNIIYISGGARSGKSRYAQNLAESLSPRPIYLATAQALDSEMQQRIVRHQQDRDARWQNIEEPLDLAGALRRHDSEGRVILIDCLTLWLSNLMFADQNIREQRNALCALLPTLRATLIFVSNEVGMGIVPDNALSRSFRDEAGRLNQDIAALSHQAYFMVSGLPLRLV
ncbi:bifunctional adenosylcobinamide kinase/adenosylcobinamide-phosphate guanylyltransferase [Sphingopyxis yananensis]|jgi:adenosylcobinamide kinase/adenosylcobinamide-phosphate guanylyltransferase|uniref:bifunctional adenosylcobinamide kinase/adenosylcobinamide-phosphate guanylyltransferase n=1 Tax=Sphingopyxis yananensis TaxID=2886687 RepID=UPI001D11D77B|nr:bifunctional adenosylcobinamide kinase/adenosylcobinamide-phosphate guanylyltransferase [Sphingopyxis yananensis]MCC2603589.1 bifunctional adenosylcobinamide kinase/adenosylcobinamide-phosphate guanylyltransferase [Sphingopyxis yananensis]